MNKPLICAHAGGSDLGPANSIEAIESTLKIVSPEDFIEIDVQKTRDGELVLLHGSTVDSLRFALGFSSAQTTNLTLSQLRKITPNLATLTDAVTVINNQCGIILDVKDPNINPGSLRAILNGHHQPVYLTAANSKILHDARLQGIPWPQVVQCHVATRGQIDIAIKAYDPDVIDVWPPFLTAQKARYILESGCKFVPGGMGAFSTFGEEPARILEWARFGAHYIVTSNPLKAKAILR